MNRSRSIYFASRLAATIAALAWLIAGPSAIAVAAGPDSAAFDPRLKLGTRVSVKGALLPDGSLQANDIELRDETDDDHELRGRIDSVNLSAERFVILGVTVRFGDETEFEHEPNAPAEPGDLMPGMRVKVDGKRHEDGSFSAGKVRIRRDQQRDEWRIVGPIEDLKPGPSGTLLLTVIGFVVRADSSTEISGGTTRGSQPAVRRRPGVVDNEDDLQFGRTDGERNALQFAGEVRARSESLDNLNLQSDRDENERVLQVSGRLGAAYNWRNWFAYAEVGGVREFVIEAKDPFQEDNNEFRLTEAYVQYRGLGSPALSLVVGRQKFDEEREWFYNKKSLDAIRLLGTWKRFSFDLSASSNVFDSVREKDDQEHRNAILQVVYRPTDGVELQGFYIDRRDETERDDSPRLFGLRLLGESGRHFEYWVDLAVDRGTRGLLDPSTAKYIVRDVEASAFDLGVTYRPRIRLDPSFTASWAHGDGEPDPDDDTDPSDLASTGDGTFRQSGLERNRWKYNGVVSFRYYGELLDPELSNIDIRSLSGGLRPIPSISIDLLYHSFRQDAPSRILLSDIDDRPNGDDTDLGSEWDLVLGYEPNRRFELRLTAGTFEPGSAFPTDASRARVVRFQLKFRF